MNPQKPDHVIALFRTSTDFPSHLELKRENLSAPPRPKSLSLPIPTHLRPLISPLPPHLLHSVMLISLKQPGVLLPWTCALTVHSAWNVLLSASRVNHTITPFSKALLSIHLKQFSTPNSGPPPVLLFYTLPDILYLLESSP